MPLRTIYQKIHINFLVISLYLIQISNSSVEVPRPRGVSLSRISLYDPGTDFTCFDGSKTIIFSQVNDDYCDCPDGSDEPGTSACPQGSFYCSNAGYRPEILSSDRVNDGICDCCDGTDEYSGWNSCANTCLEVGRAAREEAARLAELYKVGKQLRADLSQEGQTIKTKKKQKLEELIKQKAEAEQLKTEREQLKTKAEEAENNALEYYRALEEQYKAKLAEQEAEKLKEEATENFKKLDSNNDDLVDVAEIQTRQTFDRDRDGQVSEEEAKLFMGNKDSVDLNTFIDSTWKQMKPFVVRESGIYKAPSTDGEQEQAEDGEVDEEEEEEEDEEEEEAQTEKVEEETPPHVQYDENTQKLVNEATAARNQFLESERNVKDISDQIRDIEDSLTKDFGPDEEFASLEGQCFDYQDHEYTYKLCPFDKTVQVPKSGSMETRLGQWSKWDGPTTNPYIEMLYDRGQNCWNGPARSTKVKVSCGAESKLTAVSEPNRCEYAFDFETPAACRDGGDNDTDVHDEL